MTVFFEHYVDYRGNLIKCIYIQVLITVLMKYNKLSRSLKPLNYSFSSVQMTDK